MALLPQDPAKQKQLLIGMVPLILAVLYYQFYHTPRALEAEEIEIHVEDLTAKNRAAQTIVATHGDDLPRRLAIYEANINQLEELIPRRADVPILIDRVTEQAQRFGIQLTSLQPMSEEAGEHYSQQVYELQVLGDYHTIAEYLTAIGSLPQMVRSRAVRLTVESPDEVGNEVPELRAIFEIETFVMQTTPPDTVISQ